MSLARREGRLLWRDSSSESDSDEEYPSTRAPRIFRIRLDHMNRWSDEEFEIRFRLSKGTVFMLEERLSDIISPKTKRNHAVSAMLQILLVLRFCATGCMLQSIADFSGIHKSSAGRIVRRVIYHIAAMANEHIYMPRNGLERGRMQEKFYKIAKFPRVIGAIDCTHIRIISPGGNNAEYYRNRKGFFSLNVQVVGDADLKIMDIVSRWPGSSHDQTIFNNSRLMARLENGEFENGVLLGDSGYALKEYLITPIPNPTDGAEQLFNESQIRTRNPVERLFGVLKRRFPILSLGIRLSLEATKPLIIACAVLHNIAVTMNERVLVDCDQVPAEFGEEALDGGERHNNFRTDFIVHFENLLNNQ